MGPSRKKQKVSEDGAAIVTVSAAEDGPDPDGGIITKQKSKHSRTLFVRSLPASTTNESLAEFFSQSAPLKHATAVIDKDTKQCKGYGFVTFAEVEDAQKAKAELHESTFAGKKIKVEVAEPRHRDVVAEGLDGQRKSKPAAQAVQAKEKRDQELNGGKDQHQAPPRLIIRNLPWSIKEPAQLSQLFTSYGKVKEVKLPKGKNGTMKGFGFVLLRGRKNAEKAMAGINGKEVDGRPLAVDWAAPKDTWEQQQAEETNDIGADSGDAQASDIALDTSGLNDDEETSGSESEDGSIDDALGGEDEDEGESGVDDESMTEEDARREAENNSKTLFLRNVPFTLDEDGLYQHFRTFGPLKYARIVMDYDAGEEGRSRGTGFVCFHRVEDAQECLKGAPRIQTASAQQSKDKSVVKHSLLEDTQADPSGRYTVEGRVLQVSPHVDKAEAQRLATEGTTRRNKEDKRRLYLLREGTIAQNSPLYASLSVIEQRMREASAKQRQDQIKKNPSLHLSLTRLAIRNMPRFITSKDLKALARQAVVGFAEDVKAGKRQPLTREELARGGNLMKEAERDRKRKGKGVVKQAKIIFESREGSKVSEDSGAGRSRGYGFVEYSSHRCALMGLRWLNGHLVKRPAEAEEPAGVDATDGSKRLIVEFAIENAQVVQRREAKEQRFQKARSNIEGVEEDGAEKTGAKKRRRDDKSEQSDEVSKDETDPKAAKLAVRQQIIGRKRAKRRARKGGA